MQFRSLLCALVFVVEPDDIYVQFMLTLWILVASLAIHLSVLPYQDKYCNNLESIELGFLIVILTVGSCTQVAELTAQCRLSQSRLSQVLHCAAAYPASRRFLALQLALTVKVFWRRGCRSAFCVTRRVFLSSMLSWWLQIGQACLDRYKKDSSR